VSLFESRAGRFVVKVMWLPMPDSVWIEDRDEQRNETIFYPSPFRCEYECGCGFKTVSEADTADHLADEHGIMDPDKEVDFWTPYYYRKDLPRDARIVTCTTKRYSRLFYIC
jgi:hypothetical protein